MEHNVMKMVQEKFSTPCYVFDFDLLKSRMELIKNCLGDKIIPCYAMKANPFLIGPMDTYTEKYEVCSPGEYEICYRMGISPEKIVVSGVNKTFESMDRIMELSSGAGTFTIESEEHYRILSEVCKVHEVAIKVLLRLSSGNQFGMDKETLEKVLVLVSKNPHMTVEGIHYYSGTQKKPKKVEKELADLEEYAVYIKDTYGITLKELEYGPGLSVTYFMTDTPLNAKEQLLELKAQLDHITAYEHITIEMGRFIASCCGYYFTKVMDVKRTESTNYAIVDGGIHQLNYYGQIMGMKVPYMELIKAEGKAEEDSEMMLWNVCGSLCTVNDVILKGAELPVIEKGDYFVFKNCGAYSVTEGMALFLSRELPQILFYSKENGFTIAREMVETNTFNSQRR
jgi:diaminopimelate decarboxylase